MVKVAYRRLMLSDLQMRPEQFIRMKGWASETRADVWDALEHCCLTELNEDARMAVVRMRKYLMDLTRSSTNEISSDRTPEDKIIDHQKKLLNPRQV